MIVDAMAPPLGGEKQPAENETQEPACIRASAIGGCRRQISYELLGYEAAPASETSLFLCSVGDALHEMVLRSLVGLGWIRARLAVDAEGRLVWQQDGDPLSGCELGFVDEEQRLTGHPDAITVPLARRPEEPGLAGYAPDPRGERYLLEIKTVSDRPRFWVLGIRDGGRQPVREEAARPEFLELDAESSRSGRLQRQLFQFSHARRVDSAYGSRDCPVYRARIGGRSELVTVLRTGSTLGAFASLRAPRREDVLQATVYADHYRIAKILFLYLARDADLAAGDGPEAVPVRLFDQDVRRDDVLEVRERADYVYDFTDRQELPPRDHDFNERRSPCPRCPYAWHCWPAG